MKFKYKKFPSDPKTNPFPKNSSALRPVIQIDMKGVNGDFGYFVLLDSGSDWCVFHASVGEQLLGLDIKKGEEFTFFGTSGHPQKAYFHNITFKIGGHSHTAYVAFSYELEKVPYGLLGQLGFFDSWSVKFEYDKENIEIKPNN